MWKESTHCQLALLKTQIVNKMCVCKRESKEKKSVVCAFYYTKLYKSLVYFVVLSLVQYLHEFIKKN